MDAARRMRLSEEVIRRISAAVRSAQLYAPAHPLVQRSLEALYEAITQMVAEQSSVTIGVIDQEIIVNESPVARGTETFGEFVRRLKAIGIERLTIERGVTPGELHTLVATLAHPERRAGEPAPGVLPAEPAATLQALPHVKVGRIALEERVDTSAADVATIRRMYADAVGGASRLWDAAQHEGRPDPAEARRLVDGLAQAVAQNRTALIALTALKQYDNYTFAHMVNVSILTMAQARGLGVDGPLLREFGLAGLMHDIGKVRTPLEILNKPSKLTEHELAIMALHVVDGAEILTRTPDMPPLAPVVAFEHHLRLDGTGYPVGVRRATLNIATMLCGIADVYDAMRSQRVYQQSFPTDRILAVLKRNDETQFDRHLVRRFSQLMGIYPPGNMVRLDTGEYGVVLQVYAPDPYRPRVRVVLDAAGRTLARTYDVNLWEAADGSATPRSVTSPADAAALGLDPLTYL